MIINRLEVLENWRSAKLLKVDQIKVDRVADTIMLNRKRYQVIQDALGIPWFVVGAIHCREASLDFNTYLGNGQRLNHVTTLVPKGRGPFKTWEEGAIDAIKLTHLQNLPATWKWDLVTCLIQCEIYNGTGYQRLDIPSPYVWACTTVQKPGKYVADGKFDPHFIDEQPGCAAILLALKDHYQIDIGEDLPVIAAPVITEETTAPILKPVETLPAVAVTRPVQLPLPTLTLSERLYKAWRVLMGA